VKAATDYRIGDRVLVGERYGRVVAVHPEHGVKIEPENYDGLTIWELAENVRPA
jgi:hypothetical protein